MHKLGKGLKKKIKGKKGKDKDDDYFDPAELERYRREQQARQAAEAEAAAAAAANGDNDDEENEQGSGDGGAAAAPQQHDKKEESEEWLKFKLLTSGTQKCDCNWLDRWEGSILDDSHCASYDDVIKEGGGEGIVIDPFINYCEGRGIDFSSFLCVPFVF